MEVQRSDMKPCDKDFAADNSNHVDANELASEYFMTEMKLSSAKSKDLSSESESDDYFEEKTHSGFQSISSGLVLKATYEHVKRNTEIMCVTYNERMRLFVIIDSSGITTWKRDPMEPRVHRALVYPNYEYRLIANMVYAKKYNCYFVLAKDFSLKVYNKDFVEMCSVCAEMRSVMFMLFNPVRDELITGGVAGTQVWGFYQQSIDKFGDLRTHGSYGLTLKYELPSVGGGWVKHVELDHTLEHLYCCSDHDLFVYDLEGNLLFKFERAHSMSITGCRYSRHATVLITSSLDSEVKVWSLLGGLVHIFRGHSRAVTNMILHPATSSIVITCSLDGTVRMWSLDTMDCLSSVALSVDGLQWMGLTDDNLLYLGTPRALTLWNLNYNVQFWALVRSPVTNMVLCGCKGKTTRVVAISEDNSVRIMARSNSKSLTTVLPPPSISPLRRVMSVCYSREFSVVYLLINPQEIWVYTARTDPACRVAVWHLNDIQKKLSVLDMGLTGPKSHTSIISHDIPGPLHKATENRNEGLVRCCSITMLTSAIIVWSSSGYICPRRDSYLLVGLEDGRIFFMDPVIKGERYLEFKTGKDPVIDMCQDDAYGSLITVHKLKDVMRILVWCVPDLTLQHELFTAPDLKDFVRESSILMTGHGSGSVVFHTLEPVKDSGHHRTRNVPLYEELVNVNHKPEHLASVLTVDVCATLKIFCSCSENGCIKIWYEKVLLTEIMLDSSLSSMCFLNNRGDLLVGYQKHIFYIDHTKVCPQLKIPELDVDSFDKESYICEDQAVLYEGVLPNHDHVTLENYLVPFDIEFSKDFLEGRVTLEPEAEKEEVWVSDDDASSQISRAPSEIYMSAESTPQRRLSYVDLILGSEVSRYDLLKQMKKTLDQLASKDCLQQKHSRKMRTQPSDRHNKLKGKTNMGKKHLKSAQEKTKDLEFCFPHFGKSPGPTPESSRSSTPEISCEPVGELKELSTTSETIPVQTVEAADIDSPVTSLPEMKDKEKPEFKATSDLFAPQKKFGLSDVKVDVKTIMKDTKKATLPTTSIPQHRPDLEPGLSQRVPDLESRTKEKKSTSREKTVKKKMMSTLQRRNKIINKPEKIENSHFNSEPPTQMEKRKFNIEPPTQMHTLGLIEMESDIPASTPLAGNNLCLDLNETEVPIREDEKLSSIKSLASKLEQATVDDNYSSADVLSVPPLPSLPLSEKDNYYRPLTSKSRSGRSVKRALDSVPDLHVYVDGQEKSKIDLEYHKETSKGRDMSGASETLPESAVTMDGVSVLLTISNDLSTSKTELILEDQTEIKAKDKDNVFSTSSDETEESQSQTTSYFWQHSEATCQTPAFTETPGQSCKSSYNIPGSYPPSQLPINLQLPVSESPDVEFSDFDFESLPEPAADFDQPEKIAISYKNTWRDKDLISLPTCLLESPDQYFENMASPNEHIIHTSGSDFVTQTHFKVVCPTSEATKTKSHSLIEDSLELDKPELQNVVRYFKQRPHTAHNRFSREDLQAAFEASMVKYKQLIRSSLTSDKLYKNDDLEFSENWHERQIQRHLLLRMQAVLRALNVQENQQGIPQPEETYRKQYITEDLNTMKRKSYNTSSNLSANREQGEGNLMTTKQRARTIPSTSHRTVTSSTSFRPRTSISTNQRTVASTSFRPRTSISTNQRTVASTSFRPRTSISTNQRTVASTSFRPRTSISTSQRASTVHGNHPVLIKAESVPTTSRPHTVSGSCADYIPLSKRQFDHSLTMFRNTQQQLGMQTDHHWSPDYQEKTDLIHEKPFRFRLRQVSETQRGKLNPKSDPSKLHDTWLLDPRNPESVRPRSSKSIPSKCYQYILVSKHSSGDSVLLPTTLEKYLLALRFPQEGRRLFRKIGKFLEPGSLQQTNRWDNETCNKVI